MNLQVLEAWCEKDWRCGKNQLSNENNPGCLGYIRDYTTRIPMKQQVQWKDMESKLFFFVFFVGQLSFDAESIHLP